MFGRRERIRASILERDGVFTVRYVDGTRAEHVAVFATPEQARSFADEVRKLPVSAIVPMP